jgi:hypothetical protein
MRSLAGLVAQCSIGDQTGHLDGVAQADQLVVELRLTVEILDLVPEMA